MLASTPCVPFATPPFRMKTPPDTLLRPVLIGTLAAWMALVVASGAFAAMAFPAVRDLAPVIPSMPIMTESHWKVVAGVPAQRNFEVVQAAGWLLGACSILLALACRGRPGFLAFVQWCAHLGAIAMLAFIQFEVVNPMNDLSARLHEAMRRGDLDAAHAIDRVFKAIHGFATPLMSVMVVVILVAMVVALIRTARPSFEAGNQAP